MNNYELTIKGRISNVRWLETQYNAKKVRGDKGYWNYVVICDDATESQIRWRIESDEGGIDGVWCETRDLGEATRLDAEIAAEEAADSAAQQAAFGTPLLATWEDYADVLRKRGTVVNNATCAAFAVEQIGKLAARASFSEAAWLYGVADKIERGSAEEAAKAFAAARPRLQQMAAKYR